MICYHHCVPPVEIRKHKSSQAQWFMPGNSSYLGGRDLEDLSSRPAQKKVSETLSQSIN
jgi:hypothetical protein